MYIYRRRRRLDGGSIFFTVLFILVTIGISYLAYVDRGKFWDILPFVCIPTVVISLILIIINFTRRTGGSILFVLFFILSISGLILSNFLGPPALINKAERSFDNKNYEQSIYYYRTLLDNYPNSRLADKALENIPYAYFLDRNYTEAINSFKEAINLEILSSDDLEIKKILEECYVKLAQKYHKNDDYSLSAENYLNAVIILKEIKDNFPDTNEAFISIYKIPEYLYNAALNFNKIRNWDKSTEALEDIVNNYYESKYFYDASYLLSNTYINKAVELVNSNNYQEGIEEFLKILDLDALNYTYNNINDYQKNRVFSNIPLSVLKNIAKDKYNSGDYEKTLFLCEVIVKYNPEKEEEIIPLLIDSKLKIIASSTYNLFEQPVPERKFWGPEKSILIIEDNTEFDLTIYLKGPEYKIIKVEKNSTSEIEITAGSYEAAAELNNPDILPYYGKVTYEESQKYREEYTITN